MHDFTDLYAHMEWADERVWRQVLHDLAYGKDETLLDMLAHVHMAQHAFLDVWKGRSVRQRDPRAEYNSAAELGAWAREFYPEAHAFLATLEPGELDQEFQLPWAHHFQDAIKREPVASTLGETVLQLAMHSVHHRAQVVRQIRLLGGEPPIIDFIAWVWMGRPQTVWLEQ